MMWRGIEGKENLIESDEDYTVLRDARHTPPRYLAFKRQWEKPTRLATPKPKEGEAAKLHEKPKRKWAPPIVLGGFDSADLARAACEDHSRQNASKAVA